MHSSGSILADKSQVLHVVYICAAIELLKTLGLSIAITPQARLIEGAVCQRYYGSEGPLTEHLCKSDAIQSDIASLLGVMGSLHHIPGLFLTIPYGILSEHFDRRFILLISYFSTILSTLYLVGICSSNTTNLKLLWLSPVFEIFGGGGTVAHMILRTIIAEGVPASSLSVFLYRLSAVSQILRFTGTSFGSWLLQHGPASSSMLVGVGIFGMTIPLMAWLPRTGVQEKMEIASEDTNDTFIPLSSTKFKPIPPTVTGCAPKHYETARPRNIKADIIDSIRALSQLILHNRTFQLCPAVMFLNTIALGGRGLIRPWISKRYDWTLAQTGYILSVETVLSVTFLFLLQYFESSSAFKNTSPHRKRKGELLISKASIVCAIVGSVMLFFAGAPVLFFIAGVVITCSVGFLDAISAYFTAQLEMEDIGRLYSTITIANTLAAVISSPVWSVVYSLGYRWGGLWIGLPFLASAGVFTLLLLLLMMLDLIDSTRLYEPLTNGAPIS